MSLTQKGGGITCHAVAFARRAIAHLVGESGDAASRNHHPLFGTANRRLNGGYIVTGAIDRDRWRTAGSDLD
jgi:hypothetical protein